MVLILKNPRGSNATFYLNLRGENHKNNLVKFVLLGIEAKLVIAGPKVPSKKVRTSLRQQNDEEDKKVSLRP